MRAIARAMVVLCAWVGRLLTCCPVTLEKLSASEPHGWPLDYEPMTSEVPQPTRRWRQAPAAPSGRPDRRHSAGRRPFAVARADHGAGMAGDLGIGRQLHAVVALVVHLQVPDLLARHWIDDHQTSAAPIASSDACSSLPTGALRPPDADGFQRGTFPRASGSSSRRFLAGKSRPG